MRKKIRDKWGRGDCLGINHKQKTKMIQEPSNECKSKDRRWGLEKRHVIDIRWGFNDEILIAIWRWWMPN